MSEPFPVNPTVQKVDDVIHALLYDVAVNAACAYIKAQVPFLGLPIISSLTNFVVTQVANIIYKYMEQFISFSIIDFQTEKEAQDYLLAVNNLQKAQESGDKNAIDKSIQAFRDNLRALIHFDGA